MSEIFPQCSLFKPHQSLMAFLQLRPLSKFLNTPHVYCGACAVSSIQIWDGRQAPRGGDRAQRLMLIQVRSCYSRPRNWYIYFDVARVNIRMIAFEFLHCFLSGFLDLFCMVLFHRIPERAFSFVNSPAVRSPLIKVIISLYDLPTYIARESFTVWTGHLVTLRLAVSI